MPAALQAAGYQLFPINPLAVSRYRDRYAVSRAKSDPGDALVLANILRTDLAAHRPIPDDSELAGSIRVLARAQQDAVWDRQQAANKLRSLLREYYPTLLATFDDLTSGDARATLERGAHPGRGGETAPRDVAGGADPSRASTQHRLPGRSDPGRAARRAVPPTGPGRAGHGPGALAHLRALNAAAANVVELEHALAEAFVQHPDAAILTSFPGLGTVLGARILGEIGDDRTRFADAKA